MESIYDNLRLYINFIQPSFKLIAKERIDNKTRKRYDTAKIAYRHALEREDISLEAKAQSVQIHVSLNPAELRLRMDHKIAKLWKISR